MDVYILATNSCRHHFHSQKVIGQGKSQVSTTSHMATRTLAWWPRQICN